MRYAVQAFFMAVVLWMGVLFVRWVHGLEAGRLVGERPPGVEGFLPIASLMALKHLLATGEWHPVHPAGLVILLLILALGLLLKKAFCSWVCPIGTLSEWLASVSRHAFGRKLKLPRLLDYPLRSLKYLVLSFFCWAILVQMGPHQIAAFLDSPYNRVADIKMLYFFSHPSAITLQVLSGLVFLSLVVPYFWCRYLCPYGGLLGWLSLLSPLKITRHPPSCIECGLCSKACPAHLPVGRLARVTSDECTGCLSCVAACPVTRALRVETPAPWRHAVRPPVFAALVVLIFFGGVTAARLAGYWRSSIPHREYLDRIRELDAYGHTTPGTGR